jgi:epsilon-lactone hydrolase
MGSWQARGTSWAIRTLLRCVPARDPRVQARWARRLSRIRHPLGWLSSGGLTITPVREGSIRGEWVGVGPSSPARGVILYLHGGGYVACSPATHRPITAALARLTRRRVLALDYRLAPEHRFPAALVDCVAAYRWLLDRGIGAESIALAGDSAGGGLVLATMVRARDEGLRPPASGVCFSPWTDLAATGDSLAGEVGRGGALSPESVAAFAAIYLGDTSPHHPHASPLFADLHGLPPVLIQAGSGEFLLDDARRVHAKILASGGASTLSIFEDVPHAWHIFDPYIPESRQALRQAATFIDGTRGPSSSEPCSVFEG